MDRSRRRPVVSRSRGIAAAIVAISLCTAASAIAQDKPVYRYNDAEGRVIYSDRLPPGDAKGVQAKRLTASYIENSELPLAAQIAVERFPVTLFTFACGDPCTSAENLLNRRGVPFTTVNVEEPKGQTQLKAVTGEMIAPVLQVGDTLIAKGFLEARWQTMLDQAGYPKTPPPKRTTPGPRAPTGDAVPPKEPTAQSAAVKSNPAYPTK